MSSVLWCESHFPLVAQPPPTLSSAVAKKKVSHLKYSLWAHQPRRSLPLRRPKRPPKAHAYFRKTLNHAWSITTSPISLSLSLFSSSRKEVSRALKHSSMEKGIINPPLLQKKGWKLSNWERPLIHDILWSCCAVWFVSGMKHLMRRLNKTYRLRGRPRWYVWS